jgi:oxaloacetate decarboxylase gamma subunit
MEQTLLADALNLTLFGMGFVFLFLILLVGATRLMSIIVQFNKNKFTHSSVEQPSAKISEEAKFVIKQAIKMHRGA